MAEQPTIADLFEAEVLTDADIARVVQAVVSGDRHPAFQIVDGYSLDLAAAVQAHDGARRALGMPETTPVYRQIMATTAIMLAKPTKA